MKITRRQLRRIIKEAVDRYGRDIYTRQLGNYSPRSGELPPNPFVVADKYRSERDGPEMRKKGFSDGFNGEFPQEEEEDDICRAPAGALQISRIFKRLAGLTKRADHSF